MNDIDFVLLWVDGSDPEWLNEKNFYSPVIIDDSNSNNRFKDLGLLKYWFRAVEAYTPWVRKIHFVTWGHLPNFLNTDHPQLHIVRHEDYMPHEWLPTFSSHALEMNMHRIPDLSEHFVYFNDDTFIMHPVQKDFFFKKGLPCTKAVEVPIGFIGKPEVWSFAAVNDIGIINKHFKKREQEKKFRWKYLNQHYFWFENVRTAMMGFFFPDYYTGFKTFHCPAAFLKSTFIEIWDKETEKLELTSSHKFRNKDDVNQWVAQWWQIASGKFEPIHFETQNFAVSANSILKIQMAIEKTEYDMICISDNENTTETDIGSIIMSFEKKLPHKSAFER